MSEKPCVSVTDVFGELDDPRVEGRCDHKLVEVIIIAVCAGLTGAESWVKIETFGVMKEAWLRTFLELPNGIPSHDTFRRIFAALDAEAFQRCLVRWVEGVLRVTDKLQFPNRNRTSHETVNKAHRRIDIRRCCAMADPVAFEYIRHHEGWADLTSLVWLERERHLAGKVERETAYHIRSLPTDAAHLLAVTRAHWTVENSFHGVLDVNFREDDSRLRLAASPHNMAVLRHLTLNILKADSSKGSLRNKRYIAALDDSFLFSLIAQV